MLKFALNAVALVFLVVATVDADEKAADQIAIDGNVIKAQGWSVERIRTDLAKEIKTVDYKARDAQRTATVVPLLSLIKASGLEFDPAIKHQEMRCVVLVEGRDGYFAAFALAEMLPEVGNREVWVALEKDGKPLEGRDLPVSLITPSDQKPSRSVFGVKAVRVFDPVKAKD